MSKENRESSVLAAGQELTTAVDLVRVKNQLTVLELFGLLMKQQARVIREYANELKEDA